MGERQLLRRWAWRLARSGILLALAIGCKLPPPNLRPPDGPEELNKPPEIARYNDVKWPKECMVDPNLRIKDKDDNPFKSGAPNMGGMQPTGTGFNK